jgi:hypothetical protein
LGDGQHGQNYPDAGFLAEQTALGIDVDFGGQFGQVALFGLGEAGFEQRGIHQRETCTEVRTVGHFPLKRIKIRQRRWRQLPGSK